MAVSRIGRPPRADEANGIYPMLNRGNRRDTLFNKAQAFEPMMALALERPRIKPLGVYLNGFKNRRHTS